MQHAREDEPASEVEASPAAVMTMAQLMRLVNAAHKARRTLRFARSLELFERALAAAEAALPADSLVVAKLLELVAIGRCTLRVDATHSYFVGGGGAAARAAYTAAWRNDAHALPLSRRALELVHARWCAGTLFTLAPHEREFMANASPNTPPPMSAAMIKNALSLTGALTYTYLTAEAVLMWPPTAADEEMRTRIIYSALIMITHMIARCGGALPLVTDAMDFMHGLLSAALSSAADGWLLRLRTTCGLTAETEQLLRKVAASLDRQRETCSQLQRQDVAEQRRRAATFRARHGMRRCALPECNQTEPQPEIFKVCGRCRGAAYCSAARIRRRTGAATSATMAASSSRRRDRQQPQQLTQARTSNIDMPASCKLRGACANQRT
jgi:hypothetical protein